MDLDKLTAGFRQVMEGLGLDPEDPHLKDTPLKTARAWYEDICAGLGEAEIGLQVYPVEEGQQTGLIALQHIPVKSLCAHHLLPFVGYATVGFLPGNYYCGLSHLSRVVNHFARRPQMQELLTHQVAQFLSDRLAPRGVGVAVQASHYCMELRGVNHSGIMNTSVMLGTMRDDPGLRAEFLALAPNSRET
ncbi:MAG: GTP cyclohydrolase I [SAR324 cluster bacterium]|nr:GTP cyclohydrolase I [SAR324 cluster bacterium]